MYKQLPVLFILLLTSIVTGCYVYAPPVRVTHGTAPGKMKPKQKEIAASASQLFEEAPPGADVNGGIALTDKLVVEAGGGGQFHNSALTYAGLRYSPLPQALQHKPIRLGLDFEFGAGVGVGGKRKTPKCDRWLADCDEEDFDEASEQLEDGIPWHNRLAGGTYIGVGLGFNVRAFDLFIRGRLQLTRARNIPTTFYASSLLGFQFSTYKRNDAVKFYFGAGPMKYQNDLDENSFLFGETGLTISFGPTI